MPEQLTLDLKPKFKQLLKTVEKAFKTLHKKGNYKPEDLDQVPEYKKLVTDTNAILVKAIDDNDLSENMLKSLNEDTFLFSALKTNAQLFEASRLLLTKDKTIKSFNQFSHDVSKIKSNYNENYLEAEYDFAVGSVLMAERWELFSEGDRYVLQYRTAADDRVRQTHEVLHNITLPKDDPFWDLFFPPNGWRCRCTTVEVLKKLSKLFDSEKAYKKGEIATTQIGKNGKNKLEIFRFNAGKQKVVFPPKHPYNKVEGAKTVKKIIKNEGVKNELKNTKDVSDYFGGFAKKHTHYFHKGFKYVKETKKAGVNGYTYMQGDVYLKTAVLNGVREGINNINKGKKTTLDQEIALSTMHHEILHNAHKLPNTRLTKNQTRYMELANEFVSRKKLPVFMENLGGELQNKDLVNDRKNTGYNTMVRNYDQLVSFLQADKEVVLNTVENYLLNKPYATQSQGLMDGLIKGVNGKMNKRELKTVLSYCLLTREDNFKILLDRKKDVLKPKN